MEEEMGRRFERKELVGTGVLVGRMTPQRDTVLFFIPTPDMGGECDFHVPARSNAFVLQQLLSVQ